MLSLVRIARLSVDASPGNELAPNTASATSQLQDTSKSRRLIPVLRWWLP